MEQTTAQSSEEDPFVVAVRDYILATLTPLIPASESAGRFMFSLLRRALRSATREDLEQVVLHCVAFTDGLRAQGFISDELAREAHDYLTPTYQLPIEDDDEAATDWPEIPGPGGTGWTEPVGEIDPGQTPGDVVLSGPQPDEQGMGPAESDGAGHQTTMEGDSDDWRSVGGEALQADGSG